MSAQDPATIVVRGPYSIGNPRALIGAALVCVVTAVFVSTRADPDLWGHLRFGLDVLATHTLPSVDPYSFTQDKPQLYHEWLGAVLIAAAYHTVGPPGLVALKLAICFACFLPLARDLRRLRTIDALLMSVLIAWNMVPLTLFTRPQLWTMLCVLVLVRLLQDRRFTWIPPLFAVWANLHGGWILGIGVLGTWCAATACEEILRSRRTPWKLFVLPLVAFAATVLNPYGWHLWTFLAETVGLSRGDIAEWQPLFADWQIAQIPIAITVGVFVAVVIKPTTRPTWAWILVCAVLIYSSIRISRVAFVAMPAIVLIILPSLVSRAPRSRRRIAPLPHGATAIALVPLTVAIIATGVTIAPAFNCIALTGEWVPDPAAIPVLRQGQGGGRIVTFFDWGEYAMWHLGPRLKISIDGRRETLYSDRVLAIHHAINDNADTGSQWLIAQRPEYVWLKTKHRGRRDWLAMHGYRIDWESDKSWVAVRGDLPRLSGPSLITSTGCFPGP